MPPSAPAPAATAAPGSTRYPSTTGACQEPDSCANCATVSSADAADEGSVESCLRKPSIGPRAEMAASISRVGAGLVGADRDEVGLLLVGRHQLADLVAGRARLGRGDLADEAGDGGEHVDRGVVARVGEVAREDDVAVEDAADGVGDRLVHVVAVDQHGVERGDRAGRRGAGALEQLRQHARRRDGV